jgi:molybdate transport system substrate-binding protein
MNQLAAAAQIVVFAASSLTNVLQTAGAAFERETGVEVLVNVNASNSLARQIAEGAPADVFCSADEAQLAVVERAGRLVRGTRVTIASNRLVVIVSKERAFKPRTVADLVDPAVKRIAVGDPTAVPVGVYTRAYLERVGLWSRLEPKLVPTINVRAALAAVENGDVDAGFVYATDAAIASRAAIAFEVPPNQAPPIGYPAAITSGGKNAADGRRFLAFLQSEEGRAILRAAGFIVPEARSR